MVKLKLTKLAFKAWNKSIFGQMDQKIMELEERVSFLKERLQTGVDDLTEKILLSTK